MPLNRHIERLMTNLTHMTAPMSVLDIGCGDGRVALWVASRGATVIAFDSTWRFPAATDIHVRWLMADLHNAQLRAQFDAVLLLGVLHYLRDAADVDRICGRVRAWMKPGAVLLADWITDGIRHVLPDVYLPSVQTVCESLKANGFRERAFWLTQVEHEHGGPRHRHELAYGAWVVQ